MIKFVYVALILSLPVLLTLVYAPFAPAPLAIIHKELNKGVWYTISEFTMVWAVSAVATGLWLIFCFGFKPVAKLMFRPEQMTDKPVPVYSCYLCLSEANCVDRATNCERFRSILNPDSYCTTGENQ